MANESQSKYTPGPWKVNPIGEHCLYVETEAPEMICDMQLDATPHNERLKVQANARLIAAAPELLAMLKECLAFAIANDAPFQEIAVKALISKAEGR